MGVWVEDHGQGWADKGTCVELGFLFINAANTPRCDYFVSELSNESHEKEASDKLLCLTYAIRDRTQNWKFALECFGENLIP